MSARPSHEDLRASSTLLNTLHAEHQGAFVREVVLAKLESPEADESRVPRLQARLRTIGEWGARLWRREPLVLADGSSPRPQELELALEWLQELGASLERTGRALETALDAVEAHEHDGSPVPEAALVAGGLAWAAYAWENDLRGVIQFGESLGDPGLAAQARERLPEAAQALTVAHQLLQRLESESPPGCALLVELHRSAAHLPELFAAKTETLGGLLAELRELRGD